MNINTLPSEKNKVKLDLWRKIAVSCDMNIVVETNKDQRLVQDHDKTEKLITDWWQKSTVRDEYLREEKEVFKDLNMRQQGGVSVITNDTMLAHVCE